MGILVSHCLRSHSPFHYDCLLEGRWTYLCQLLVNCRQRHSLCSEAGSQRVRSKEGNCQRQVPKVGEREGSWHKGANLKTRERQQLTPVNTQCNVVSEE